MSKDTHVEEKTVEEYNVFAKIYWMSKLLKTYFQIEDESWDYNTVFPQYSAKDKSQKC